MRSLSGREFAEWMAYATLEPFGEERADFRMATLAALTAELHRDPEKRSEPFSWKDFMPRFGMEADEEMPAWTKEQAVDAIKNHFMALVKATGGQDLRSESPPVA